MWFKENYIIFTITHKPLVWVPMSSETYIWVSNSVCTLQCALAPIMGNLVLSSYWKCIWHSILHTFLWKCQIFLTIKRVILQRSITSVYSRNLHSFLLIYVVFTIKNIILQRWYMFYYSKQFTVIYGICLSLLYYTFLCVHYVWKYFNFNIQF